MNKKELNYYITKCSSFIENIGYINGYEWGRLHNEYDGGMKIFINKPEN